MIATQGGSIFYMFRTDIKVHAIIDESSQKYVKLQKRINFDGGLVIIKTTAIGEVTGVKFKHNRHHFHTDTENDVCLGSASTRIHDAKIHSFNDLLKLKNTIINMMSICNTHSMFKRSYMAEEMERLINQAKPGSLKNLVMDSDW